MKKTLLFIACALGIFTSRSVVAQSFSVGADTVWATLASSASNVVPDYITNISSTTDSLKWSVTSTNFPSDWLTAAAFSICDDQQCRSNASNQLWGGFGGTVYHAPYGANTAHDSVGDFHLLLDFSSVTSTGTYYVTIKITDSATNYSTNETYVISRWPASIANVNNAGNDIVLYPNPAHDEVNLVYDPSNDVKTIVVYNIIGKVMGAYKVTDNNGANLNLENMPSGIYFLRLFNSHGDVAATRKFTKQ